MKYVVVVPDGMADHPLEEFDNRTPLEIARTPNMDRLAADGIVGRVKTVPDALEPGSDVANLSILGYDPLKYYSGRGPLEAASMGIFLGDEDVAFRCNFVTTSDDKLTDYSAGHISTPEAEKLIDALNQHLSNAGLKFYPGVGYRHLMVMNDPDGMFEVKSVKSYPPHNHMGKNIRKLFSRSKGGKIIRDIVLKSREILDGHEINATRIDLGENPANLIWLWGQGKKPAMPLFYKKYGVNGAVISAVDLIKGIAKCIGLTSIDVPGATGYYDTDYAAKASYGIESLKENDFLFLHIEAPDEAGHNGDLQAKITAIENIDSKILGPLLKALDKHGEYRIVVLPDHPTPVMLRCHTHEPVPFVLYGTDFESNGIGVYSEKASEKSFQNYESGPELLMALFGKIKKP